MKQYLSIIPIALLVGYSQLIVKWRTMVAPQPISGSLLERLLAFASDPLLLSGYLSALVASFLWLFVVAKLPLAVAFPIYIGATFLLVLLGSHFILNESLGGAKIIAALLILAGIALGISSDA